MERYLQCAGKPAAIQFAALCQSREPYHEHSSPALCLRVCVVVRRVRVAEYRACGGTRQMRWGLPDFVVSV